MTSGNLEVWPINCRSLNAVPCLYELSLKQDKRTFRVFVLSCLRNEKSRHPFQGSGFLLTFYLYRIAYRYSSVIVLPEPLTLNILVISVPVALMPLLIPSTIAVLMLPLERTLVSAESRVLLTVLVA